MDKRYQDEEPVSFKVTLCEAQCSSHLPSMDQSRIGPGAGGHRRSNITSLTSKSSRCFVIEPIMAACSLALVETEITAPLSFPSIYAVGFARCPPDARVPLQWAPTSR